MDGHELWLSQCEKIGFQPSPRKYDEGTRTSQDAANQLGCEVAHIAKSIVFEGPDGAVVVITSGSNRVERKRKLKRILGFKPGMASPDYVRKSTGYEVGGVPPFGHMGPVTVLMDEDLMQYELVWGAGGTHQTVFPITPRELMELSGAEIGDVKQ
ncbi:MAG: YbaK/EbsC family protein [Candidatus Thalassarchaeaceae archaeon]|jgi:prolyl-tRNA editing enzyme YbaK/EbsC (Cys-tRNA(Pro) deacylase)|nr:YbaK/EbsC family protein [Candidatus Thalassarchaeaceae archaeon]